MTHYPRLFPQPGEHTGFEYTMPTAARGPTGPQGFSGQVSGYSAPVYGFSGYSGSGISGYSGATSGASGYSGA